MARTGVVFSEAGFLHDTGPRHPEGPERLRAIQEAFSRAGLDAPPIAPRKATREELLRVHSGRHIDTIEKTCAANGPYPDPDTAMVSESWDAALFAAGGAIEACRSVLEGGFDKAFCAMRPPGHHAERDRAMGFCLFNSVAIAARWLLEEAGLQRVAILDWDVHHGNGTQHSFYDDPKVYYASLHQFPHYPGTGLAEERGAAGAAGTNLNVPMPPGAGADAWVDAVEGQILPAFRAFEPQFLLISCGFDAHKDDPLSDQRLDAAHYAAMTELVRELGDGKVVSLLEGGYGLAGLGESAVAHFRALQGAAGGRSDD